MIDATKNFLCVTGGFLVALSFLLAACGAPDFQGKHSRGQPSGPLEVGSSLDSQSQESGLSLFENMANFDLEIAGCSSGYSAFLTQSTLTQLKLFKNDRGCLAKLLRFTSMDGTSYAAKINAGFSNYQIGDSAIFTNSSGTKIVKVSILAQLSTPIAPTDSINYKFSSLTKDSETKNILKPYWDQVSIGIKNPATVPNFQIKKVVLSGLINSSRKGLFDIYLECSTLLVAGKCQGVPVSELRFDLNLDVGNDCSSQGPAKCEVSVKDRGATTVNPGDALMPNGGYILTAIDTPAALVNAKNLVLALMRIADNSAKPKINESIRAWNFDIELEASFELAEVADLGIAALVDGR